jgi:methionine biosynthesis protein MetW
VSERARRVHAYENPRPDVQALVPPDARRILDLGCSSGALGAALKARQSAFVTGLEADPGYAAAARERLDEVIEADLEQPLPDSLRGDYDCLVAADVLEHLADPWRVLAAAVTHLRPGGTAVVSLPNIRYWHTFYALLVRRSWPRDDFGIFDRTHLRFFARRDAVELLESAGLAVERVEAMPRLVPGRDTSAPWPLRLSPFFAYQYVLSARAPSGERDAASG